MRRIAYTALTRLPAKVGTTGIGIGGVVASVWPAKIRDLVGVSMTPDNIRWLGIAALSCALIYFIVLWLLKPTESSQSGLASGQSSTGAQSPIFGTVAGSVIFNPPPPAPAPAPSPPSRPSNAGHEAQKITDTRQPDTPLRALGSYLERAIAPPDLEDEGRLLIWLEHLLMDAISLKGLAVWGRRGHSAIERLIWLSPGHFTLDFGRGIITIHRADESPLWGVHYSDLHFSSDDLRRIWPNV